MHSVFLVKSGVTAASVDEYLRGSGAPELPATRSTTSRTAGKRVKRRLDVTRVVVISRRGAYMVVPRARAGHQGVRRLLEGERKRESRRRGGERWRDQRRRVGEI
jgi:hypothetical protein